MVVRHQDERPAPDPGGLQDRLDRVFRALAHSIRRDILRRTLLGPVSVSGLALTYAMSFAAVQKHVAVLEEAGLVQKEAVGRERYVRAVPEEIARARACLDQLEALWRHRLTALDAVLTQTPQEE
jgi:DNA-binding transcriptional ArsR family regulator